MSAARSNRRWCRLSLKDTIKASASILIPVMIGVFTLVLAWQEHVQGQANRQNDIDIANHQRDAQIQLEEFRRDQDRQLATNIQMDSVLSTFYREMSELILDNNTILNDKTMRQTFVRPKVLAALRQLDPSRKALIIIYLYESNLLSDDKNPLDLSGADLSNIDLSSFFRHKGKSAERAFRSLDLKLLSLINVRLVNASFADLFLTWSNFEHSDLTGANFYGSSLRNAVFYQTNLSFTNFTDAETALVYFEEADLTGSNLNKEQLYTALSSYLAILPNGQQQHERFNLLSYLRTKQCSLDEWQHSLDIDVVPLSSQQYQCAYRGQTVNATLIALMGVTGWERMIDENLAYIEIELDVQGIRRPQDSITLPLNVNLRFLKSLIPTAIVIDKDPNLLESHSIDDLNTSTNFHRFKGASACPPETRKIEIEIKFTPGAMCNNINLYIVHSRNSNNEYDDSLMDI